MTRIAVIGEALVDVIHGVPHPGGSPVNVAVGLARLGFDVTMATRIGRDDHGRLLEEHVAAKQDWSRQLWGLLAFTLWYERHVEQEPPLLRSARMEALLA